ncbi:MAG: hypothetical protein RL468_853 [Pseudomonadota bacterium]
MRFRLFHRRLTISAPRMAVRSTLPWPLRWASLAIVLGFCSAIGLWTFELGKDIAGLDNDNGQIIVELRSELRVIKRQLEDMREERDKAVSLANTSTTLLTTERATQESLTALNKKLEAENRSLRDDLGFFEKLIPTSGASGELAIRGLQADLQNPRQLKWQVLVIQAKKNAPEFSGQLELIFSGLQSGKPWTASLPQGAQQISFKQYGRLEGVLELPAQTVVKSMTAKVLEGKLTRASQTIKLLAQSQ